MMGSALPQPSLFHIWEVASTPTPTSRSLSLATTAASFHIGHLLRLHVSQRLELGLLLHSCFQKLSCLDHVPRLKDVWHEKAFQFRGINFLQLSKDAVTSTYSTCLSFFDGGEKRKGFRNDGVPHSKISSKNSFDGRRWTNILLAANVLQKLEYTGHIQEGRLCVLV